MRSTKATTAVSASAMKTLALCLVLSLSGCASTRLGKLGDVAVIGAGIADYTSTRSAINNGGREANPLMGQDALRQALVKGFGSVAVVGSARALENRGRRTLAHVVRAAAVAVWTGAAIHNYRRMR